MTSRGGRDLNFIRGALTFYRFYQIYSAATSLCRKSAVATKSQNLLLTDFTVTPSWKLAAELFIYPFGRSRTGENMELKECSHPRLLHGYLHTTTESQRQ